MYMKYVDYCYDKPVIYIVYKFTQTFIKLTIERPSGLVCPLQEMISLYLKKTITGIMLKLQDFICVFITQDSHKNL